MGVRFPTSIKWESKLNINNMNNKKTIQKLKIMNEKNNQK